MTNSTVRRIVEMACAAAKADSTGPLSSGEALTVAMVLNRPDWLAKLGYTMLEAVDRIGPEWMALLPEAVAEVQSAARADLYAAAERMQTAQFTALQRQGAVDDDLELQAQFVTYSMGPGYRDARFKVTMRSPGTPDTSAVTAWLRFDAQGSTELLDYLWETHEVAWSGEARRPIDLEQYGRAPRCFYKVAPRPQITKSD